jgi:chromosome segregation protein
MRLTTIKLAGFKSFVDPTVLHLPTNMSGIVGPNGCGKSNIIDAVRWVMGESAASRLRGDALVDVIFSGSSGRKPVGTAMVELVFDNADGGITGEYASYAEIAVKRLVSRDGQSQYFLNGTRCRRRDITDLFLGTGLGPRSYSIIEQGMISQIVEADPDQLRNHLEEAAGISRYKERRKETESRIKATRENLDRVRDVRDEVDKQLEHLKRQARAAERWQGLKAEHAKAEAEMKALGLRAARAELAGQVQALGEANLDIEQQLARLRQCEADLEAGRERHAGAGEHLNTVQGELYRIGAEIARVEQQIQHNRELAEQLGRAHEETGRAHRELGEHLAADSEKLDLLQRDLAESGPRLEALHQADTAALEALRGAETALADWQSRWDTHAGASSQSAQAAEVERTRLDYLDRQCLEAGKRRESLLAEQAATDLEELERGLAGLADEHATLHADVESLIAGVEAKRGELESHVESERERETALSVRRGEIEALRGRLGSLEALQNAALRDADGGAAHWLEGAGIASARRLGEALQVEPGWERAVETVLFGWLDARLIDAPDGVVEELAALADTDLGLMRDDEGDDAPAPAGTLACRARGPAAARRLLARVRTAESVAAARVQLAQLARGESLITPAGEWFGHDFARIQRGPGAQVGVLAREREIQQLKTAIAEAERDIAARAEALAQGRQSRIDAETARDEAQGALHAVQRRLAETAGRLQGHQGRLAGARERVERIERELLDIAERLNEANDQARAARARLDTAVASMGDLESRRRELDEERRRLLEAREEARMTARDSRERAHELALAIESQRAAAASLEQSLLRMRSQREQLAARQAEIAGQLASNRTPETDLDSERQTWLNQRLLVDKRLVEARTAVSGHENVVREREQERHLIEQELQARRERLAETRLREQEHRLHADSLTRAIAEAGFDIEALLAALPDDADGERLQSSLVALEQKIQRLEPVNLAAIQEFDEQSQRKNYLDAQLADLGAALETLEGAIRKIDKETRQRFRDTFERVNAGMQELFPRLFGGGHAHLEMTGDDLLSTGVAIMARPPGKRVSSISLLSGGEKALTAVALVFAIFRLNPAPFCLLDEVDAPLDEANVGRFTALVGEMSERVQFIFVTHNKATMEAAMQLCGVTMREPGVSRLVQVDLAEAARLAGAA